MKQRAISTAGTFGVLAFAALLVTGGPARGQEAGSAAEAPIHVGPLAVAPVLRVTDIGYDDNIFGVTQASGPKGDFTTTFSPAAEFRLTSGLVRASAQTAVRFSYFKDLSRIRSMDTDGFGRVELPLRWITPFVEGGYADALQRQEIEIDGPIRRVDQSFGAGATVAVTSNLSLQAKARRSGVDYRGDTLYLGNDLAYLLDRRSNSASVAVRYAVTSLTTVVLDVNRQRDEFTFSPDRNSLNSSIMPGVEFSPLALVSGYAGVGVKRRVFDETGSPTFQGVVALVRLQYNALETTRFGVQITRDLGYSYRSDSTQYEVTGVNLSVTQALFEPWDVRFNVGRSRLNYQPGLALPDAGAGVAFSEIVYDYGIDLGFRTGHSRIGFLVNYRQRDSGVSPLRDYQRLRAGASLTYVF